MVMGWLLPAVGTVGVPCGVGGDTGGLGLDSYGGIFWMVPMCTFPFFFFESVPLFAGGMIVVVGKVQTDFLSDEGGDFVSCVFRAVDVTLSGFGALTSGLTSTGVGGFEATLSGMDFTGVGGFKAVSFFERSI